MLYPSHTTLYNLIYLFVPSVYPYFDFGKYAAIGSFHCPYRCCRCRQTGLLSTWLITEKNQETYLTHM